MYPSFELRVTDPFIYRMSTQPYVEELSECRELPGYEKGLIADMRRALRRKSAAFIFAYLGMDSAALPYQDNGFSGWAFSGYIYAPMHVIKQGQKRRDIDGDAWVGKRVSQITNMIADPDLETGYGVMGNMLGHLQHQYRYFGYDVLRMTLEEDDAAGLALFQQHAFKPQTVSENIVSMVYLPDAETGQ